MYIQKLAREKIMKTRNDVAVSPVVGVMLMLVVVIIIAAVVSGFAGGLVGGSNQKAPALTMDISISNNGIWSGSHFSGKVTGVEQGIATRDLKIVTAWSKTLTDGNQTKDSATIVAGTTNTNLSYKPCTFMTNGNWKFNSPLGYGTGVNGTSWPWQPYDPPENPGTLGSSYALAPDDVRGSARQWFGNYNLVTGTTLYAEPFGHADGPPGGQSGTAFAAGYGIVTPFTYTYGSDGSTYNFQSGDTDQMQAVLGNKWNLLRAGDTVSVKVIHVPTGKTILQKNVIVEG